MMKIDFLVTSASRISTYFYEKIKYSNRKDLIRRYSKIEQRLLDATSYQELIKSTNVRQLDGITKLKEIKDGDIRILFFLFNDKIVLLGTFIKKSKKTPQNILKLNNQRIETYLRLKRRNEDEK